MATLGRTVTRRNGGHGNAIDDRWIVGRAIVTALAIVAAVGLFVPGCAQQNALPVTQGNAQNAATKTTQEQATSGSYVRLTWTQAQPTGEDGSGLDGLLVSTGEQTTEAAEGTEGIESTGSAGNNASVGKSKAKWLQINNLTITTGGTAPSATGTSTGSASQAPSVTATASPEQRPRSDISAALPIGVAPGGIVDQQATATGRGSTTSGTSKESANELRWAKIEGQLDKLEKMMPLLEGLLGTQPGAGVPQATTQPAK